MSKQEPNRREIARQRAHHLERFLQGQKEAYMARCKLHGTEEGTVAFIVAKLSNRQRREWNSVTRNANLSPLDCLRAVLGAERVELLRTEYAKQGVAGIQPFTGKRAVKFAERCRAAGERKRQAERIAQRTAAPTIEQLAAALGID